LESLVLSTTNHIITIGERLPKSQHAHPIPSEQYPIHCNPASLDFPSTPFGRFGDTRITEDYEDKCLNAVWHVDTELGNRLIMHGIFYPDLCGMMVAFDSDCDFSGARKER
jgi:hypothetical protein